MNRLISGNTSRLGLFLLTAAGLCLVVLASSGLIHAEGGTAGQQIEGTWLITVTPDGGSPPPLLALGTFSAGGGLLVTDSGVPPTQGNVYQGTWTQKGPREFVFTFLGFQYTGSWFSRDVHSGYVKVNETVTLDPSGAAYTGVGTLQTLDLKFGVLSSRHG
jgi:hypothetical protein